MKSILKLAMYNLYSFLYKKLADRALLAREPFLCFEGAVFLVEEHPHLMMRVKWF